MVVQSLPIPDINVSYPKSLSQRDNTKVKKKHRIDSLSEPTYKGQHNSFQTSIYVGCGSRRIPEKHFNHTH